MENRIRTFIFIVASWMVATTTIASDIAFLEGDWTIAEEASLAAMATQENLTDPQLEEKRSSLIDSLRTKQPKLSIDDKRLGLVIGNKTMVMDYQVDRVSDYAVELTVTLDGQTHSVRIDRFGNHLIRLVLGGNYDWYVWKRASGGTSALDEQFIQPPTKDPQQEQPEDVFKRVARRADQGDYAAIHAMHSMTSRGSNSVEDIAQRWGRLKSDLNYQDLQIRQSSRMAQHPGVWFVQGRYQRGDQKGPNFSLYFKTIDGAWRIVSMPELE